MLDYNKWKHLSVCKQMSGRYFAKNNSYLIYMYKEDLVLKNFQRVDTRKIQPTDNLHTVVKFQTFLSNINNLQEFRLF